MASSDRRASFSPGEQQRTKSQSSSRSHRTPPNIIVYEDDIEPEQPRSRTSRRSIREVSPTKRPESSTSNRSTTITSPTSNLSKKPQSSLKSSSPPVTTTRRINPKRKKSAISVTENETKQLAEPNDSEKQDLNARGLAMIPPDIFELITLRRLILSNNNLSGLPSAISSLINLEYLDISNNPLIVKNGHNDYSCFPREFRHLKNLHTLILAECTLKHIPIAVWNATSLQTLDLNRNKVGYIVADIGNLTEIRHLRLSRMDLDTLPPEIGFCDKLETIDLTGNPIDTLPETLIECRQLNELKINYKTFYKLIDSYMLELIEEGKIRSEHIPQVIFELENIRILDFNQTKINSIPNEHTLYHLTELYLSNNSFFDIQESICTIEQLKILDMSHNRIQFIPDYFIQMKQLEIFNVSFNKLTILSNIFGKLSKLKKLNISHNQIDRIDKQFSQSKSILILDLSNNKLTNLPNELCTLEQLETLDLRYNKLEYLPSSIRRMIGLKSMNTFSDTFHRSGLHLLGNLIIDPPSYIWKSTDIQTLFNYIETKEKNLVNHFYHLKIILLGPKNIGKTTLATKLVNNQKLVCNTRKTIDMYVSILQQKYFKNDHDDNEAEENYQRQTSSDGTSSTLWIENRVSTSGDYPYSRHLKTKRIYPPPIKTYRSTETSNFIIHKSIVITKNNFYFTIFDLTSEPNFEILYPLIYDSNALYILPINLTILLNIIQAATSLNENENQSIAIDFNALLTHDWLYCHIFRYLESISDHCQEVFIAIVGLIDHSPITSNEQQLLDDIHAKVNAFLFDTENINLYSQFFPKPIHLDDEEMSTEVIEQLERIAQQWNIVHHKQKRQYVKQRLSFIQQHGLTIDYETCLTSFEEKNQLLLENNEEVIDADKQLIQKELNQMSFDDYLDYLKLIGDILCFGQKPNLIILIKPYYLLNKILSTTLFRPCIDQWLNYDDNMVFRFSGYYPTQKLFDIDCQRLLTRGEFTWKMLNVLFYEQNNDKNSLMEENILYYCRLMERLYLGYVNESNLNHREFTTIYFVCPWLMTDKCSNMNYIDYFKSLEQERHYDKLRRQRARRIKQQQLWFPMDDEQEDIPIENSPEINHSLSIPIPDLPAIDQIEIFDFQIVNQDSIQIIKIRNQNSTFLPDGFYERLLICLHCLFNERLDYYNFTLGRTIDKDLIQIERFDEQNQIQLTINNNLLERIRTLLHTLFSFYPNRNFRIET